MPDDPGPPADVLDRLPSQAVAVGVRYRREIRTDDGLQTVVMRVIDVRENGPGTIIQSTRE